MSIEVRDFCDKHNACSDGKNWATTQASMADVFNNCERGDWLMWALKKRGALDKPTSVKLACEFALRVLPNYEAKYDRKEPRLAIEAALAWLENQTEENARVADSAAYSYASADSADSAAYAAARAARAASAYSAADAADSAESAAYNAAASAAELKAQCEIIRNIVKNPWRK